MTWTPAPLLWSEFKIGRKHWRVWLSCPDLSPGMFERDGEALLGVCLYSKREIWIDIAQPVEGLPVVWLHEVMHAALEPCHSDLYLRGLTAESEEGYVGGMDEKLCKVLTGFGLKAPLPHGWQPLRAWAKREERR